jgi:hypothetical protein
MTRSSRWIVGLLVAAWVAVVVGLNPPGSGSPARESVGPAVAGPDAAGGRAAAAGPVAAFNHPRANRPGPVIVDGIATFDRTVGLSALAEACAATATAERPGAVVLGGGLRDAHARVTIAVPCAIQLPRGADIHLAHSRVASETLNIGDTAFEAGKNHVHLDHVRFTGSATAGLLIELTDPADLVEIGHGSLTYPLGIAVRLIGDRVAPDHGGTVRLHQVSLASPAGDGDGIVVVASTKDGVVRADHSTFLADRIGLLADSCWVRLGGDRIDCRAATVADDLKKQAEQAKSEQ